MSPAHLQLQAFESYLKTRIIGRAAGYANEVWDTIGSTNDRAAELALAGAPEGVVVAARKQTAGRGRHGRTWESPLDSGLYISFLLRPALPPAQLPVICLATGVAAARAVEHVSGIRIGLKWVNDLTYGGKKLGGILAEMPTGASAELPAPLIIGIGINVRSYLMEVPPELANIVVHLDTASGHDVDTNLLAATLALELERVYTLLLSNEQSTVLKEWKQRAVTIGRSVRVTGGDSLLEGTATDILDNGALVVIDEHDKEHVVYSGIVSVRSSDGSYA